MTFVNFASVFWVFQALQWLAPGTFGPRDRSQQHDG
jgi:hypothetical protein